MAKDKSEIVENKKEENIKYDTINNENSNKDLKTKLKDSNIYEEKKRKILNIIKGR